MVASGHKYTRIQLQHQREVRLLQEAPAVWLPLPCPTPLLVADALMSEICPAFLRLVRLLPAARGSHSLSPGS